jgi:predicted metal-binding membrane protein
MAANGTITLKRERNLMLAVLLVLAAAAWTILVWQSFALGGAAGTGTASILTMGMGVAIFLAMWVSMMAAMMFPTAAPMVLMYARVQSSRRAKGRAYVPSGFFVASYLLVWAVAGALAYLGALGVGALADHVPWLQQNGPRISGGVIVLAGLYQLTPLKAVCLRQCRGPLSFVLDNWREGRRGAMVMGLRHGGYCVGCCWLLFVLLFPLGIMNLAAMGVLTVVIFLEKSTAWGARLSQVFGVALLVYGAIVISTPAALPGSPGLMGGMGGMSG